MTQYDINYIKIALTVIKTDLQALVELNVLE